LNGCGLRIGEALDLKTGDVRYGEGLIYIRSAKGRKDRRVPHSGKAADLLRSYQAA
jgi:integrase